MICNPLRRCTSKTWICTYTLRIIICHHIYWVYITYYINEWNTTDLSVCEAQRLMGLKINQGGIKQANSLKRRSAMPAVRYKLTSTWWSNWKKDLRLLNTTFSSNDWNLSLMGLYRGHSNTKCASFSATL